MFIECELFELKVFEDPGHCTVVFLDRGSFEFEQF